jgi:hypothetical protein
MGRKTLTRQNRQFRAQHKYDRGNKTAVTWGKQGSNQRKTQYKKLKTILTRMGRPAKKQYQSIRSIQHTLSKYNHKNKAKIKYRQHKPKPKPPDNRLTAGHTQMGRLKKNKKTMNDTRSQKH